MGESRSIEQRLDEIESRSAIADLVLTYALHIRCGEPDQIGRLFTEDGVFEVRDGHPDQPEFTVRSRYGSRAEIHSHMSANKGRAHPIPLIRNLIVEFDGDVAHSTCVMDGRVYGTDIHNQGEYHDDYRRVDGRWYFSQRIYTIFRGLNPV